MRRPGSAALDLAYVAAGRVDGFWEIGLTPWDTAAGTLLIQEAGGRIGTLGGDEYQLGANIVAGAPKVYEALSRRFAPHVPEDLRKRVELQTTTGCPRFPGCFSRVPLR